MTPPSDTRLAPRSRLRLPRRTARLRLTALYGGLFLLSGVALARRYLRPLRTCDGIQQAAATEDPAHARHPASPRSPSCPAALSPAVPGPTSADAGQHQTQSLLPLGAGRVARLPSPLLSPQLVRDEHQLTQDQHRLAQAISQLAQAVHQVAQAGSVQAAQRASDSHQLLVDSGIALAIVAALAVLAGWLVAGSMLRPIRTITRTARRISSTSLHERLALDGPQDELKELGDTLDDLFARLEAAFEAQRRFVANASHELRTPLTRERTLVQVALGDPSTPDVWRTTGQELLASNREQETLIDGLLTLASSESGLDQQQPVDLADICQTVLSRPDLATDRLGVHLETDLHTAPLDGDPRLIERLVANLVDNAVSHNVSSGRVQISTDAANGTAVLTVTNSGPIIPPREIDRLFQPFQRLDPRRALHTNGHGLGLSIVRAIAAAHGATITAQPLPEGGLSLSVAFPSPDRPRATVRQPVDLNAASTAGK